MVTLEGQTLLEMCIVLGKTPEELGELRDSDPVVFSFLEESIKARLRGLRRVSYTDR